MREAAFVRRTAIAVLAATAALAGSASTPAGAGADDATRARALLDLGDSLSVGAAPFLRSRLPGYRVERRHDVGLHAYDAAALVARRRAALPAVVVVSAGTNDDPGAVSRFARTVRETVAVAGRSRCVIWATVVRPPYAGVSYTGYNRALRSIARTHPTLHVLDWSAIAHAHRGWFGSDGVHPSMTGYRARAMATARLIRRC